jgi:virginiamycin B lyase
MDFRHAIRSAITLIVALLAAIGLGLALREQNVYGSTEGDIGAVTIEPSLAPPGQAYVFRFDPVAETFETFALPTVGANPHDVEVIPGVSGVDVWFTEPGADQIGRLVYTDTADYEIVEYGVPQGSTPLHLAVDGAYVWFTAREGNWIGRLPLAAGSLETFPVPTANGQPAGIDVGPDGSIWFTEMAADKIGRLEVNTPADYDFTEYPIDKSDVGAYGIAVQDERYVWFSETKTGIVKRLKVADGTFGTWTNQLGTTSYPYTLLMDGGRNYLWITEREHDQISFIELTTLTIINTFDIPADGSVRPTGLTMLGSNQFWFSGQDSGQLWRLAYTSPAQKYFDSFPLPIPGLWAMDVAADSTGVLWVVAYTPHRAFLPLALRS